MTTVVHCKREPFDVYIGRACRGFPQSKWANPFKIGKDGTRAQVVAKYAAWLLNQPNLLRTLCRLKGKRLGCWCAPNPCHGDILAHLADYGPPLSPSGVAQHEHRAKGICIRCCQPAVPGSVSCQKHLEQEGSGRSVRLRPLWAQVDWAKSNTQIAHELGVSWPAVYYERKKRGHQLPSGPVLTSQPNSTPVAVAAPRDAVQQSS